MTKIIKSYGSATAFAGKNDELVISLPRALLRDFGAKLGDTFTFSTRGGGGFFGRIYRRTGAGWFRLERN